MIIDESNKYLFAHFEEVALPKSHLGQQEFGLGFFNTILMECEIVQDLTLRTHLSISSLTFVHILLS